MLKNTRTFASETKQSNKALLKIKHTMKKYFTRDRLRLFDIKSGQRVLLVKKDEKSEDWFRICNDGREKRLSIQSVLKLIFEMGGYDKPTKRRPYTPAVLNATQAFNLLKAGKNVIDYKLNYYEMSDSYILRNGKRVPAFPVEGRFIEDVIYKKDKIKEAKPAIKCEQQTEQENILNRQKRAEIRRRKMEENKRQRPTYDKQKATNSTTKNESFWDWAIPVAGVGIVGIAALAACFFGNSNNNQNRMYYV